MIVIEYTISSLDNLDVNYLPDGTMEFLLSGRLQEMTTTVVQHGEQPSQCQPKSQQSVLADHLSVALFRYLDHCNQQRRLR